MSAYPGRLGCSYGQTYA